MTIYRTSGPWGAGKGSNLTAAEVDGNFWQLVQDVAAKAVQGVGIADVIVVGNQFTFVLTDHTLLGPYTLPTATFNFRGAWTSATHYFINDIITNSLSTYLVLFNHVSGLTFDPNANDGHGNNYYGLLLSGANQSSWDFGFTFQTEPTAGTTIQTVPVTRAITIPADMAGSVGHCDVPPTSNYVVLLTVDAVTKGTITVDVAGTVTFDTGTVEIAAAVGQVIRFVTTAGDSPAADITGLAVTVLANQT